MRRLGSIPSRGADVTIKEEREKGRPSDASQTWAPQVSSTHARRFYF